MKFIIINRFSYWDIVGIAVAARLLVDDWTTIMWVAPSLLLWTFSKILFREKVGLK